MQVAENNCHVAAIKVSSEMTRGGPRELKARDSKEVAAPLGRRCKPLDRGASAGQLSDRLEPLLHSSRGADRPEQVHPGPVVDENLLLLPAGLDQDRHGIDRNCPQGLLPHA